MKEMQVRVCFFVKGIVFCFLSCLLPLKYLYYYCTQSYIYSLIHWNTLFFFSTFFFYETHVPEWIVFVCLYHQNIYNTIKSYIYIHFFSMEYSFFFYLLSFSLFLRTFDVVVFQKYYQIYKKDGINWKQKKQQKKQKKED